MEPLTLTAMSDVKVKEMARELFDHAIASAYAFALVAFEMGLRGMADKELTEACWTYSPTSQKPPSHCGSSSPSGEKTPPTR